MTNRRDFLKIAGATAFSVTLLAGCSYTAEIDARLDKPPAVEPLPMTMGIYYPAELRDYHLTHYFQMSGEPSEYELGPPTMALFDQVFASMFAGAVPMTEDPSRRNAASAEVGAIALRIERFRPYELIWRAGSTFVHIPVEITYRATLYSSEGNKIASWTVDGTGSTWSADTSWPSEGIGVSTAVAMREAAAKFVAGFRQQPGVAKWLAGLGLAHAPPPS